MITKCFAIYKF